MKTIQLNIEDNVYQDIVKSIHLSKKIYQNL